MLIFLLYRKISFILYGYDLDYHICFMWKFEVNWPHLLGQVDIWTWCSFNGQLEKTLIFFHLMTISTMPQILGSWQLCHKMLCGSQKSYFRKIGYFLSKCRWSLFLSKLEGPHGSFWEIAPFSWSMPHPSPIPRPRLPGLFKLSAPLTILADERCSCCAHILGPHPLAI